MKRREFVERVGMGSAVLLTGGALGKSAKTPTRTTQEQHGGHDHAPVRGDKAHAVVAFGQWVPFDRLANAAGPNDRTKNNHVLTPFEVTIKPGGAVSFIISGFHQPTIYGPGTQVEDIKTDAANQIPAGGGFPALVNDPTDRVFRGIDPRTISTQQDRIENVTLSEPGRYLAICAVVPHFVVVAPAQPMHGFINVRGEDDDKGKG